MQAITPHECSRIAQDLQIRKVQVESVVQLLDEGNTVPFITRYRKERTGGLNEEIIRQVQARINFLRQLHERKQTILKTIETQGKLTPELRSAILAADTTKRLEDLYLPYKPKKRSLAMAARDKGLEPLALAVWHSDPAADSLTELLPSLVNPERELATPDDVALGVQHLLAEMIAETAAVRAAARQALWETGKVCAAKNEKAGEGQGLEYKDYFQFTEPARQIPAHRILALNRGEKEGAIKVRLEYEAAVVRAKALHVVAEHLLTQVDKMPPPPPPPKEIQQAAASESVSAASTDASPAAPAEAPTASGGEQGAAVVETPSAATPVEPPAVAETLLPAPPVQAGAPPSAEEVLVAQAAAESPAPAPPPTEPPASAGDTMLPAPPLQAGAPPAPPESAGLIPTPMRELHGEPLTPDVPFKTPHVVFLNKVLDDALQRLLLPSLEREIRNELTDEAEGHAVAVFARNLRSLLLQPPLHQRRILAIDPGFRTGCKLAVLDEYGTLLDHGIIHPFAPIKKSKEKKEAPAPRPQPATGAASVETPASAEAPVSAEQAAPSTPEPAVVASTEPATTPEAQSPQPAALQEPAPPTATDAAASDVAPPPMPAAPAPPETPPTETAPAQAAEQPPSPPAAPAPPPVDKRAEAKTKLVDLIKKHAVQVIALGNGTGCRETEEIVAEVIGADVPELSYVIVNEAGASVYSVSPVGREEFPDLDSVTRSTVSIGRRLQDPLAELVKVEPQHIGVGLYQHDLGRKELKESLDAVVESCVNQVGVNVNTASIPLLRHVSGLNQMVARELVEYRKQHGPFQSRDALMQVPGLGPQRFIQAAGFLKIAQGPNPLDRTWIHPESYPVAEKILGELGYGPTVLEDKASQAELQGKLRPLRVDDVANRLNVGAPTVEDILHALARPGLDPRDELPPPIFKKGILKLEDLQPGMELKGTVLNVVDFGAFVDIGLKDSGLVHISQMANRYIKSPYDVVAVNDVVTVWVLAVDKERNRVSLTMIQPGTERKPLERRPAAPRGERADGGGPPRGRGRGGPRPAAQAGAPGGAPAGQGGHQGGRPPRGRQGGPPRGPGRGRHGGPRPDTATPASGEKTAETAQPRPQESRPLPPPRRPRREPPRPKLSQEAIEGKVPLRTFGELSALFAAKHKKETAPAQPATPPAVEPAPEAQASSQPPAETPPPPAAETPAAAAPDSNAS